MNPEDGWGRSIGLSEQVLGNYETKEKAIQAKAERDASPMHIYHDVGPSWIETGVLE